MRQLISMDFLDPRLKRSYNIRLLIGYILVTVVIGLASIILVYGAYGYGINTKTGEITQNGLLFVDSQPVGAQITINGRPSGTTTARLVLPAGNYSLSVTKQGYREWKRDIALDEHSVARFNYPLLFPTSPVTSVLKNYSALPPLISQSPDNRWLVVEAPDGSFDVYDTNALTKPPQNISLPSALLSSESTQFTPVAWADDNDHLLLKHEVNGGSEFVLFDRAKVEQSININKTFNIPATQVFLRNNKSSQFYIFDQTSATVRLADLAKPAAPQLLLSRVIAFNAYSSNLASYVTDEDVQDGKATVRLFDNGKTFRLTFLNAGSNYFMEASQFNGHWYYVVGSDSQPRINIYKDPLTALESQPASQAFPLTAINLAGAQRISLSEGSRFIAAAKDNSLDVYDLDAQKNYSYNLSASLAGPLRWLDDAHFVGRVGDQLTVMDYDSLNMVTPATTVEDSGGYLSRDLHHLLTVNQDTAGNYQLLNIDMRAGTDLPKQPAG